MIRRIFYYLSIALLFTAGAQKADAQLEVVQGDEISFGTIFQTGAMVHKVITIRNVGKDSVRIKGVTTSCGCTAALVTTKALAPGKETDIRIQFNPAGYIGNVTKYIYISNSYPERALITIRMTGNVAYALQPTPGYVLFNNAVLGKRDSSEISLSNTSGKEMRITGVDMPSKELTYKLSRHVLKPGDFANLKVYLDASNSRDIDGYIIIHTTSDRQPQLQVRVFAGVISR